MTTRIGLFTHRPQKKKGQPSTVATYIDVSNSAELVTKVRQSVTIDWTLRESARAKIKVLVKRILRKHGYPPDLQDEATDTAEASVRSVQTVRLSCRSGFSTENRPSGQSNDGQAWEIGRAHV